MDIDKRACWGREPPSPSGTSYRPNPPFRRSELQKQEFQKNSFTRLQLPNHPQKKNAHHGLSEISRVAVR